MFEYLIFELLLRNIAHFSNDDKNELQSCATVIAQQAGIILTALNMA